LKPFQPRDYLRICKNLKIDPNSSYHGGLSSKWCDFLIPFLDLKDMLIFIGDMLKYNCF